MDPPQRYSIGELVDVQSWTRVTRATIVAIEWIFHHRLDVWTWGYQVDRDVGLTFNFIPEGYLRKIDVSQQTGIS